MGRVVLFVMTLCACNQVFDLRETGLRDGGGGGGNLGIPFDATYCRTFVPLTEYDTYLVDETTRGGRDAVIASNTTPALLRFDLDSKIQSGEVIAAALLELQIAHHARECATSGSSCTTCPNEASEWVLHWNTTSWSASSATWTTPWQVPPAMGADDRSDEVARGPLGLAPGVDNVEVWLDYPAVAALKPRDPWQTSDDLSIQLRTTGGSVAFTTTEVSDPCDAPRINKPPVITLVLCH